MKCFVLIVAFLAIFALNAAQVKAAQVTDAGQDLEQLSPSESPQAGSSEITSKQPGVEDSDNKPAKRIPVFSVGISFNSGK